MLVETAKGCPWTILLSKEQENFHMEAKKSKRRSLVNLALPLLDLKL
jgi:hypothetical protein